MIDPDCVPRIISSCADNDFEGEYRTILAAIRTLTIRGKPVDPVTVLSVIGAAYEPTIRRLIDETPTAENVGAYMDICKEQSRLARLTTLGAELTGAATLEDAREILQRMQTVSVEQNAARIVDMSTALAGFYDQHQAGKHDYISVGFPALDEKLAVDPGDVLVIGG